MEEYLEKRMFVYRKSYNFYHKVSLSLSVSKVLLSGTSLSAIVFLPLAFLSLSAGIAEAIDISLKTSERKEEYRHCYNFYKELINSFKAKEINEEEIYKREKDFIKTLKFNPKEKYVKKMQLNGYKYIRSASALNYP